MKFFLPSLFILFIFINKGLSITLDGKWTGSIIYCGEEITNNCATEITFPVNVPGGIYTDLTNAKMMPANLIGNNDMNNRWVGNQSVTYTRHFDVDDALLQAGEIALVFHGLDTFAKIYLNDHKIGDTNNMFLRHTYHVKDYLRAGENHLKVTFSSAVKTATMLFEEQATRYKVLPVCVPKEYNGVCHVNHIRKMQASFSWDWGPAFPSMGIWKSVELIPIRESVITDVVTDIYDEMDTWKIVANVSMQVALGYEPIPYSLEASLFLKDQTINGYSTGTLSADNTYKVDTVTVNVPKNLVDTWWPNGYGDQPLYKFVIGVSTKNNKSRKDLRVGFRTVELVEEPLEKGKSFYFRINGVPIFAKGSNFIPASVFPELGADEDTIRHLLESTKEANMNMLRVWGGGVYESELFYDLADEYGIMIWQDFMFACAMYPTTDEFLQSVEEEVIQNVNRLKNHVSVVVWAGNNENEAALYGNWYGTGTEQVYKDDYIKLYVDVIQNIVRKLDNTRPFVVSSPGNGIKYSETYNYIGQNPYSNLYGDVHYYNYIKNGWDINQYPRARFSSEYGFQSLPSIYTMASATKSKADLSFDSNFIKHRQHLPHGNVYMNNLISKNFILPRTNDSFRDFTDMIYLSQVNQAVSVKIQTEFYRQAKSDLNELGEGMTMGALYWQLNDVWQAPSWSSIDFNGRWKMLHYYSLDFFAPVIVTSHLSEARDLSLFVVSDKLDSIENTVVEINVYKWNSIAPVYSKSYKDVKIEANKAKKIDTFWLDQFLSSAGCDSLTYARYYCMITLTLKDKNGIQIAPRNYVYPSPIKDVNLPTANVSIKINNNHIPGKYFNYPDYEIEVTTDNIALFVWMEVANIRGRFSENGFHMFENKKKIIFHAREPTSPKELLKSITVTTTSDIYNPNRNDHMNLI